MASHLPFNPNGPECSQTRGASIVAAGGAPLVVAIPLVAARLYTRVRVVESVWWDDAMMAVALILAMVSFGLEATEVHYGIGQHITCLLYPRAVQAIKVQAVEHVFVVLSAMFARLSVCLFLLRLFSVKRHWRVVMYFLIALIFSVNVATAAITIPQCSPIAKLWNPRLNGTCWPKIVPVSIGYVNGSTSILSDVALSVLPLYFLWKIQLNRKLKAGICGVMALGLFTAACAIARTAFLGALATPDFTWAMVDVTVWAALERNVAIIAGTIPTLGPLLALPKKQREKYRRMNQRRLAHAASDETQGSSAFGIARKPGASTSTTTTDPTPPRTAEEDMDEYPYGANLHSTYKTVSVQAAHSNDSKDAI